LPDKAQAGTFPDSVMDAGIVIDGIDDRREIDVKRKILFNKGLRSPFKGNLFPTLPYFDNPIPDNSIPPSIISMIPSEYLSATESLIEGKLLIMRQGYPGHNFL
jgi:hypothetical protein